jgi:hypothetical protein
MDFDRSETVLQLTELRDRLVNIENKINDVLKVRNDSALISPSIIPEIVNIPNPQLQPYAKRILTLVRPRDVVGSRLVRKGRDFDGGYVMLDHGLENVTAYSMGIGDDVSWDLDMAMLGCDVYQYDHTIDRFPLDHPRFPSFKVGICERPTDDPILRTIDELIEINGHQNQRDLIMKMDIEGAEWKVFEALSQGILAQFSQIVFEAHGLIHLDHTSHLRRFMMVLAKLNQTHQIIHVHANNWGRIAVVAGVFLPDGLELTYVRRVDHTFSECKKTFPTEIDMPNNHAAADYFLGALGQI